MFHARTRLIVGVLVILLAGSAVFPRIGVAQQDTYLSDTSGNQLLKHCSVFQAIDQALDATAIDESNAVELSSSIGYCTGFVWGVWQMAQAMNTLLKGPVKYPPEATLGQVVRIVVQYLETHPEHLHQPNFGLVLGALVDAWGL